MSGGDYGFRKRPSFYFSVAPTVVVSVALFAFAHIEWVAFGCIFVGGGLLLIKEFMLYYASNFDTANELAWNRWAATFTLIAAITGVPLIARTLYELVQGGDLVRGALFA